MSEWLIFSEKPSGWLSPRLHPSQLVSSFPQPPVIDSREELEQFIEDLKRVADQVWPQVP